MRSRDVGKPSPTFRPAARARRSRSALGLPLLDSLTPRLLDCTWRQKPQAGTTDETKRGLSGITYSAGSERPVRPYPTILAHITRFVKYQRSQPPRWHLGRRRIGCLESAPASRVAFQPEIRRIIAPLTMTAFQDISHSLHRLYLEDERPWLVGANSSAELWSAAACCRFSP